MKPFIRLDGWFCNHSASRLALPSLLQEQIDGLPQEVLLLHTLIEAD
jgi:hypothetical protein